MVEQLQPRNYLILLRSILQCVRCVRYDLIVSEEI
jgi:hypothetical protein